MKRFFLTIIIGAFFKVAVAQDPQFSQFYAAPLSHNPAFTGSGYAPRIIFNYRNQWPSLTANFVTSAVSVDHYIDKYNSGVGILLSQDEQGAGQLKNTSISGLYSYQLQVGDEHHVRFGVQGTYSNYTADFSGLTFPDQFSSGGLTGSPTSDPYVSYTLNNPVKIVDFSTGVLYYNPKAFIGFSVHHLTRPELGITNSSNTNYLERKFSVNGGLNIALSDAYTSAASEKLTLTPAFLFKKQGGFSQLDLGAYVTYSPLTFGVWYRGLPIKRKDISSVNQDALVALAGFRFESFSFGYSYDLTISSLGSRSGGSHEISVAYQFDPLDFDSNKNPHIRARKKYLSCPKF